MGGLGPNGTSGIFDGSAAPGWQCCCGFALLPLLLRVQPTDVHDEAPLLLLLLQLLLRALVPTSADAPLGRCSALAQRCLPLGPRYGAA